MPGSSFGVDETSATPSPRGALVHAVELRGQTMAACFRAEWDQKQSQRKSNRSHRDRSS